MQSFISHWMDALALVIFLNKHHILVVKIIHELHVCFRHLSNVQKTQNMRYKLFASLDHLLTYFLSYNLEEEIIGRIKVIYAFNKVITS